MNYSGSKDPFHVLLELPPIAVIQHKFLHCFQLVLASISWPCLQYNRAVKKFLTNTDPLIPGTVSPGQSSVCQQASWYSLT